MSNNKTSYGSVGCKDAVWNLAAPIKNKDPDIYRKDPYKTQLCYSSYGKLSAQGWQIDHIKPSSRDGSDKLRNLQALNSKTNMSKGNSLVKKSRHSK